MPALPRLFSSAKRKGPPADFLVVGLGNPGPEFEGTRHNVGADVAEVLADRAGTRLRKAKTRSLVASVSMAGRRVVLAFPQTYMNRSGEAVQLLVRSYGVEKPENVLIIHDELDLDVGQLRLKIGGGMAGHNGLRSITKNLGTTSFMRLRIGIGRPPSSRSVSDYVLRRPGKSDSLVLAEAIEAAADGVELVVSEGIDAAMATVNRRSKSSN